MFVRVCVCNCLFICLRVYFLSIQYDGVVSIGCADGGDESGASRAATECPAGAHRGPPVPGGGCGRSAVEGAQRLRAAVGPRAGALPAAGQLVPVSCSGCPDILGVLEEPPVPGTRAFPAAGELFRRVGCHGRVEVLGALGEPPVLLASEFPAAGELVR